MAEWQSLTLADIFPGLKQSVDELQSKVSDFLQKTQSVQTQITQKVTALEDIAQGLASLAENLAESGFYVCYLEPGEGWTTRLVNATNAPSDDGICAGVCILVCAADLATATAKFEKLTQILTSPVKVPD